MWLLLNQSLAPGHLALGGAIAVLASRSMATLQPEKPRIRARAIPRLAWIVAADIIRSNIAVARTVLSPARRDRVASFVLLPLAMRKRYGLTVPACFLTPTPGTTVGTFDDGRGGWG